MDSDVNDLGKLLEQRRRDLQASETRFHNIIEKSADGVIIVDKEGIVRFVNPAAELLFGRKAEELVGEFFGFPVIVRETTEIDIIANGKEVRFAEMRMAETEWEGKAAYLASIRDVTDRKVAEKQLLEREEQLSIVLEAVKEGITFSDEKGHFEVYNSEMEKITGYSMEEANACDDFSMLLHPNPEDRMHVFNVLHEISEKGTSYETETKIRTKDGRTRNILVSTALVPYKGRRMFLSAYRDITERKRAEEALKNAHDQLERRVEERTAELKAANEELKTFANIVSHDLRSPLVNIKGFTRELRHAFDVLHSTVDKVSPHGDEREGNEVNELFREDIPEALGFIESSASKMNHLINAILKLSRMGRRELALEPLDMNDIVHSTLESLAYQIEQRHVRITVGSLPDVTADHTSLEQIMGNLLENTLAYLDPERPGEIAITGEHNFDETIFHVRDNGRGISEEDIPKVFEIFQRVGKQDVPGEGMGLAYVQTMVRRHNGRIWCESRVGEGTTFTFTISNHLQ